MESIKKNTHFRYVYAKGKSYANKFLVLHYLKNDSEGFCFGVSVSGKVGKAVTRNKIKRRIKSVLRLNQGNICSGFDIIFVVRVRAAEATYAELSESVRFLLERNSLLNDKNIWVY